AQLTGTRYSPNTGDPLDGLRALVWELRAEHIEDPVAQDLRRKAESAYLNRLINAGHWDEAFREFRRITDYRTLRYTALALVLERLGPEDDWLEQTFQPTELTALIDQWLDAVPTGRHWAAMADALVRHLGAANPLVPRLVEQATELMNREVNYPDREDG